MNTPTVLFLAKYPDSQSIKEGMSQRIHAVDKHFSSFSRAYLSVSFLKNWKRKVENRGTNITQYECNFFFHFFFLLSFWRKSKLIYYHSIYNVPATLCFLFFNSRYTKVVWDVHGAVPEEQKMSGFNIKSTVYNFVERCIFRSADLIIVVTDALKVHLLEKHKRTKADFFLYPILSNQLKFRNSNNVCSKKTEKLTVIYSGNTQVWQNVNLMLKVIKQHFSNEINYYLLTGEPESMKLALKEAELANEANIFVLSVDPSELEHYYRKAHYGFVLRDDMVVNNVACPTKLVEYMHYGIIPIVKSERIGDFKKFGYEYISYKDFSMQLPIQKSSVNQKIIDRLIKQNEKVDLSILINFL
ncbi:MAG TPA: hypothetical protein VL093_06075 [Flavipsychrobacter sp.]|nr:hypothetical protein [Flavipsychrobacter sp.]